MIEKDIEEIQQAADDKALEDVEQFSEIYDDGTKEKTDEGEDSGVIVADDDKKLTKVEWTKVFCQLRKNGKFQFNCDRLKKKRRKNKCKKIQEQSSHYCGEGGVTVFGGDNQTDEDDTTTEEDDVKGFEWQKFVRIFCSVNKNAKMFNCKQLQRPKLRNKCKNIQRHYCGTGKTIFDVDDQTDEDSYMMM